MVRQMEKDRFQLFGEAKPVLLGILHLGFFTSGVSGGCKAHNKSLMTFVAALLTRTLHSLALVQRRIAWR